MIKAITKNILWVSCIFLALLNSSKAEEFDFDPYVEGSPLFKEIKVEFANHTNSYKLWLRTSALKISCRMELIDSYEPIGAFWVIPNASVGIANRGTMSYGTAYIFYRNATSTNQSRPSTFLNQTYVTFDLKSGIYEFEPFIVEVKSQPVPIYIWSHEIPVPDHSQEWTFKMHSFHITVTEKTKEEL